MPTFRVYYSERMPHGAHNWIRTHGLSQHGSEPKKTRHSEIAWEEEVEARNPVDALDSFFREHTTDRTHVMRVDEAGQSHKLIGLEDYDPEIRYIWIEEDKLMEYRGLDEATASMVTCPLCGGNGEVADEVAHQFLEEE